MKFGDSPDNSGTTGLFPAILGVADQTPHTQVCGQGEQMDHVLILLRRGNTLSLWLSRHQDMAIGNEPQNPPKPAWVIPLASEILVA